MSSQSDTKTLTIDQEQAWRLLWEKLLLPDSEVDCLSAVEADDNIAAGPHSLRLIRPETIVTDN